MQTIKNKTFRVSIQCLERAFRVSIQCLVRKPLSLERGASHIDWVECFQDIDKIHRRK